MHLVYVNLWTGCELIRGVLTDMRLLALLFTATLAASPAWAQQAAPSSAPENTKDTQDTQESELKLPVSVAKIREALETTPTVSLRTLDERPTFSVQIRERQKIEELLATLNFKAGPIPAGGLYMAEQQRVMFPSVDNPLRQPFAAFNQPELLTILIENLVGRYLGGKALNAISSAERAHAEAAARDEVRTAVAQYCSAQPNQGAGIQICDTPIR
jgi:ribosomal protein L12E/L44/L45/RPP1/RPP2